MKIGILGNGSIGCATAIYLAEAGHNVTLFGNKLREGSASKAAGAMLNVFGELEYGQLENEPLRKKFDLARSSLNIEWPYLLKKIYGSNTKNVLKQRKTIIFKNKFSSPYEIKHFNYLKSKQKYFKNEIIGAKKRFKNYLPYELKSADEFIELDEGYINTAEYLNKIDTHLTKLNVKKIFDFKNYKIFLRENKIILKAIDNKKKKGDEFRLSSCCFRIIFSKFFFL